MAYYEQALSLGEFGAVYGQDQRVLDLNLLSECIDEQSDLVGLPTFLHTLCLKYPEQVDAEHKLFPLE